MIGQRFGRLLVVERAKGGWLCQCECGTQTVVSGSRLRNGHTSSCGCLVRDTASKNFTAHGMSSTKLHRVLRSIRMRCLNPNDRGYKHYGGRGISICDEWKNESASFFAWAHANGYREGLTIDRIDNDGDYSPENCRFVDRFVQMNNRRDNRRHTYKGISYTLAQLGRLSGLCAETVGNRIDVQGMSVEQAVETPKLHNARPRTRS
jgi:hypothetical protein